MKLKKKCGVNRSEMIFKYIVSVQNTLLCFFGARELSVRYHSRYVVCGNASAPVFVSHDSFPGKSLRKRLLETVYYICWVFDECPVAIIEYCC